MSHYSYQQELDFNEARADLDSVLQNIVEKVNAGESLSPSNDLYKSHEADTDEFSGSQTDRSKNFSYDAAESPRKSNSKSSRKRRKKDDAKEEKHKPNSCVMRLFDRSVDLSQFTEDSPLYPICRAWMGNDPYNKKHEDALSSLDENEDTTDEEVAQYITSLPPPNKRWNNFLADGTYRSPRVPSPIPQPEDKLDNYIQNKKMPPPSETLLLNHLQHWKATRGKWLAKSMENEARYEDGMKILKDLASRHLFTSLPS